MVEIFKIQIFKIVLIQKERYKNYKIHKNYKIPKN